MLYIERLQDWPALNSHDTLACGPGCDKRDGGFRLRVILQYADCNSNMFTASDQLEFLVTEYIFIFKHKQNENSGLLKLRHLSNPGASFACIALTMGSRETK